MKSEADKKIRQAFLEKISTQKVDNNKQIEAKAAQSLSLPGARTDAAGNVEILFENNISMVDVIQASSRALKIISEQKKTISSNAEKAIDQLRVKIKSLREVIDSLNNKIENEHIISSNLRMELKAALNESESRAANIAGLEDKISNLELTNNELKKELNQTKIELESSKAELSNVSDFFKTLNSEIHNKLMSALEEANEIITNEDPEFQLKDVEDSEND